MIADNKTFLSVLDDGETYSSLRGASVVALTDFQLEQWDLGVGLKELGVIEVFDLTNPAHLRMLANRLETMAE